jgi:hypothetical protein
MSEKPHPIAFVWDGRSMVPLDRFRPLAQRQFRPGIEYALVPHRERSDKSHSHYFACIKKGWDNLPEGTAEAFPSPEYLRKWCLIKEGYADQVDHVCETETAASKLIALIRKMDPYAVMRRSGSVLTIWTAQSQDHASMGHEEFQRSKDKVMGRIANMCGISMEELARNAKNDT